MSEHLTAEEIERLRDWLLVTGRGTGAAIDSNILARASRQFLQLYDTLQSLRNLQPQDVTEEQLEAVQTQAPEGLPEIGRSTIVSVMRGMLASLDNTADSA